MEKEIFMILKYADFPMKYVEEKKFKTMYIDDEDYIETFNVVCYRYDQAEVQAKKKYGFFYKFKIHIS